MTVWICDKGNAWELSLVCHIRKTQPLPKIGPWRDRLDALLPANVDKSLRDRPTLIRVFETLRGFGYDAS
jgi:hypothetical protein